MVGLGVTEGVNVGVIVGVSVTVGVVVQVGADRIGPETPKTRDTLNRSTIPSRSALKFTDGQKLLRIGRNKGCR